MGKQINPKCKAQENNAKGIVLERVERFVSLYSSYSRMGYLLQEPY